jgi:hypothetical protein
MGSRLTEIRIKDHNKAIEKGRKNYYINHIEELKEYVNNIKTYKPPQDKPVYNIDNAFTSAFIDFFCRKYGISHYAYDIIKLAS